jgi:hypothetical protein
MNGASLRRGLAFSALAVAALLAVMTVRCVLEARAHLARAEQALAARDLPEAVAQYRLGARWAAPGNAYAQSALVQLERIGQAAELRGDRVLALSAYRGVHAALHASAGIAVPDAPRLARVDLRIAALMASEPPSGLDAGLSSAQRERRYRELLQVKRPRTAGVLLSCAGFFTWVGAFSVLVLRGLDREGRIVRQVAKPSFLLLVFGWLVFAVGLRIA